ncbi:unnamed protein product [Urochloa humidicola]
MVDFSSDSNESTPVTPDVGGGGACADGTEGGACVGAGSARHESVPLGGVGGGAAVEAAAMEADGAAAGDGAGGGGSVAGQLETLDSAALTLPLHRDAFTRTAADAAGRALPAVPHRSACPDPHRRLRRPPRAARPRRRLPLLLGRRSRRVKLSAEDAVHIFRNTMGRAEPSEEHLKHTESERMARKMEDLYLNQVQQRKQTEELLSRTKQELERLKIQHVDVTKKLQKANEHNERVLGQLSESRGQYDSLLSEHNHLLHDRDRAVREVEGLRQKRGQMLPVLVTSMYSEFSTSELESASENFSSSLKIGEGVARRSLNPWQTGPLRPSARRRPTGRQGRPALDGADRAEGGGDGRGSATGAGRRRPRANGGRFPGGGGAGKWRIPPTRVGGGRTECRRWAWVSGGRRPAAGVGKWRRRPWVAGGRGERRTGRLEARQY